ncbi:MAG: sulfatase-like hydrolase/transferase, partial [Verrucomicrobiota bacterium]
MIRTLTIFIFCFASYLQAADSKSKPNVLFIISDDLNYMLGSMGHPEAKTPHLDAFAKTATSFSRAYCQFPLCGPSRASIMTGQYPFKNGVTGNKNSVDPDRVTLPKHFQNHGYWAGRISKIYHMGIPGDIIMGTPGGDHAPSWNKAVNIRALETMTPGKVVDYDVPDAPLAFSKERKVWQTAADEKADYEMIPEARGNYAVIEVDKANEHLLADKMATDKAIELLQRRKQKDTPFFLAVGLVRPHFPFVALDENLTPYDTDTLAFPEHPADDYDDIPFQAINSKKDFKHQEVLEIRRGYYGAVT